MLRRLVGVHISKLHEPLLDLHHGRAVVAFGKRFKRHGRGRCGLRLRRSLLRQDFDRRERRRRLRRALLERARRHVRVVRVRLRRRERDGEHDDRDEHKPDHAAEHQERARRHRAHRAHDAAYAKVQSARDGSCCVDQERLGLLSELFPGTSRFLAKTAHVLVPLRRFDGMSAPRFAPLSRLRAAGRVSFMPQQIHTGIIAQNLCRMFEQKGNSEVLSRPRTGFRPTIPFFGVFLCQSVR